MSPQYFHTRLTFYEASDYIEGVNRRYHTAWSVARWITSSIAGAAGAKNYTAPTFDWEKEHRREEPVTPEDVERMKRDGERWAKMLNNRKA